MSAGARGDLVLGVDAGNSKTVALVATTAGEVVGAARSGPGDISSPRTGVEAALASVGAACEGALTSAGADAGRLAATAFALAGADWPEDVALLRERLGATAWGRGATLVNDAEGALRAANPEGIGVACICGTYATTSARHPDGRRWTSGFWQETGGGYALAHAAVRAAIRSELELAPPTALRAAAADHFALPTIAEVLHGLTRRERPLSERDLARFAPAVLDAAEGDDGAALAIVAAEGERLGDYVVAAARRVGLEGGPFPVTLFGGVFRHRSRRLVDALTERVHREAPGAVVVGADLEPVFGALLLALDARLGAADADLYRRLAATTVPPELFAT